MARLNAHELTTSRAFSSAVEQSKRPSIEQAEAPKAVRHFDTTRALKANNDSSTIDFAYFPDADPDNSEASELMRVPIIATNLTRPVSQRHAPEAEETVSIAA